MKKSFLIISVALIAGLVSCERKPLEERPESAGESYLSVSLKMSGQLGTKAWDNANADAAYAAGTATENALSGKAQFLLFQNGAPLADLAQEIPSLGTVGSAHHANDELSSDIVLVFDNEAIDQMPTSIMAILNSPYDLASIKGKTEAEMRAMLVSSSVATQSAGAFVMSNSVYYDGDNQVVTSTPVDLASICKTPEAARSHPVEIHVERVLAGIEVFLDVAATLFSKNGSENHTTTSGKEIKLAYNGFWIGNQYNQGKLLKDINPAWTPTATWAWNDPFNARSYWGNETAATAMAQSAYTPDKARKYTYPYTPAAAAVTPDATTGAYSDGSLVVVAGQLYDDEDADGEYDLGEEMGVVGYQGAYYTIQDFAKLLAQTAPFNQYYYRYDVNTYKHIDFVPLTYIYDPDTWYNDYIRITNTANTDYSQVPNPDWDMVSTDYGNRQYIEDWEAVFTVRIETGTPGLYTFNGSQFIPTVIPSDIVYKVKVPYWKRGQGYFYLPIVHNADQVDGVAKKDGYYGVVRNHLYQVNITSMIGMGTPNPSEDNRTITPQKPIEDEYYLQAQVNALRWRCVKQGYQVD